MYFDVIQERKKESTRVLQRNSSLSETCIKLGAIIIFLSSVQKMGKDKFRSKKIKIYSSKLKEFGKKIMIHEFRRNIISKRYENYYKLVRHGMKILSDSVDLRVG